MLDLDPYSDSDPLDMFPLLLKRTVDVLAPCLSVVLRRLLRLGSLPTCWRQANVNPISKGPSSCFVANCRPISIVSGLSKVLERLVWPESRKVYVSILLFNEARFIFIMERNIFEHCE